MMRFLRRLRAAARTAVSYLLAMMAGLRPRSPADFIAYGVVFVVGAPCIYWALLDTQPVGKSFGEVVTPVVRQGDVLSVRYDVEWNRSCRLRAWRLIIDSAGGLFPIQSDERLIHEGQERFVINVPVPLSARPGPATYRATLFYECNPWQRWISPLEKQITAREFEILPGTPTAGGLS